MEVAAAPFGLSPDLVEAIAVVESGGNPFSWNPEPSYRYLWNVRTRTAFRAVTDFELQAKFPPSDFPAVAGDPDQEWWGQRASWGLLQVMGAVARERGYPGPYLPALCDVVVNLNVGCAHLAALLRWANGDVHQALAAWNGGKWMNEKPPFRNEAYSAKVLRQMAQISEGANV
jgi:hypothetical protein